MCAAQAAPVAPEDFFPQPPRSPPHPHPPQLASASQGVIAVGWKEVDCSGNSVQYLSGNSASAAPAPASTPAPASAPAAPAPTPASRGSPGSSGKKSDNDKKGDNGKSSGGWGGWGSIIGSWLNKWW